MLSWSERRLIRRARKAAEASRWLHEANLQAIRAVHEAERNGSCPLACCSSYAYAAMLAWEQEKLGGYYLSGTEQDAFEAGWDARGPGWRTGTLTVDFQVLAGPASYQEADEKIRALLEEAGYTIGSFGISGQLPKTDPSD